eukprot:g51144.t1
MGGIEEYSTDDSDSDDSGIGTATGVSSMEWQLMHSLQARLIRLIAAAATYFYVTIAKMLANGPLLNFKQCSVTLYNFALLMIIRPH